MSLHLIMISLEFLLNLYLTLSELNGPLVTGEDVNLALAPYIGQILSEEATAPCVIWVIKQNCTE